MTRRVAVQWAHLGGEVLIASARGAWLDSGGLRAAALHVPMSDAVPASEATTRHLLDGAIAAAERAAPRADPPPMTALRWAWQLVNQWHSAHHSIALMPALIERFRRDGREDLARHTSRKLDEERGHDELPLRDLRSLGYDAEAAVRSVAPDPAIAAGVEYAREAAHGREPVRFLGYVYAIERRVIRIPEAWLAAVERVLPAGAQATSGLRAHATDLDHEHVSQAVAFIATLPAADRVSVAEGAYRITQIRCAGIAAAQPPEDDLRTWLSPFATAAAPSVASPDP